MTQWSIFRLLKITWLRVGYRWAILGYKAKRQLESWRLLTGKAPYLLVAREGFEPPTVMRPIWAVVVRGFLQLNMVINRYKSTRYTLFVKFIRGLLRTRRNI